MATLSTVLNFARAQTQSDSSGLTNANGIIFANEALLDFRRRMFAAGTDAAQVQESFANITASTGTYAYPTDMFWLKAIEVNYTDASAGNFLTAQQVDVSNLPNGTSFSYLRQNQPTSSPLFDDHGDWYEIFPTPVVSITGGIRIFYFLEPTEYTAITDPISYPESLDYRILGWRIASSYYKSLGKFNEAMGLDAEYEKHFSQTISTLGRGVQQPLQATGIQDSGWNY